MSVRTSRSGQLLVEVLIGVALAAIFIIGAASIIAPALQTGKQVTQVQVKTELAKELIDNVKSFAAGNWNSVLALATGTANKYYLNTLTSPFTAATTTSGEAVTVCSGASNGSGANGYSYTRSITVSASQVSSTDQTNFPMLFSGTYSYLATVANGGKVTNANGYDITFTSDSAGTIVLPFEQESYSSSTGAVNYWIKIPTLSHTVSTTIYVWYGNSAITTSQANPSNVWDSNYLGVWHLPNGSTLTANDSTVNAHNGTLGGASVATTGQIDGAANVNTPTTGSISIPAYSNTFSSATFSAWVKATSLNPWTGIIFSRDSTSPIGIILNGNASNHLSYDWNNDSASTWGWDSGLSLPIGSWAYAVITVSPTGATAYVCQSGSCSSASQSLTENSQTSATGWRLGADQSSPGSRYWAGSIDEARISNSARSGGWIVTEYNNENSPSTFYSIGAESTGNGFATTGACPTYNRYFYLSDIYRDSGGNATTSASGNFYDPSVKQVTAIVSAAAGPSLPVTYTLYVFRNSGNSFNQGSWLGGSGQSSPLTFVTTTFASSTNILVNSTGSIQLSSGGGNACTFSSLIGYWKFDEGSGSVAYDSTGRNNTGAWNGTQASPSGTYYTTGNVGPYAGYFNGSNWVQTPMQSITGAVSVAAWVYSSNFVQSGFVIGKEPVNSQWELFFDSGGLMYWRGGNTVAVTHAPPSNSAWHFVGATQSSTLATLYIDGVAVASGTVAAIANGTSSVNNTIDIGRFNSGYYFNGLIDDVKLYNRALTPTEMNTLYTGGTVL